MNTPTIDPREALWTPVRKADLRPGDIVRFSYAADSSGTPVVGKVAEVDRSDYIIYLEQQPEELQMFSRTAAAPITYDPDGRDKMIDLYTRPRTRTRTRWTFSRDKWAEDLNNLPDAFGFDPSKRTWPSNLDGCVMWFDRDEDDAGIAYDEYGTEYEVHRSWCVSEIIEEDNTDVRI